MKAVNITLIFNGTTEAALNFYKSIFGGDYINFQRLKEMPQAPPMPAEEGEKVLHAALPVGNSVLMGMDMPQGRGVVNEGNNFMVTLDTSSEEETTRVFNRLSEGGKITMPLGHQFWGAFFGMVTDQFGIQWMLSYVNQHQA
ncbi:MAG TPA: VOC family protein [Mucilaginibacter sp.]|jgi:PhnB protein